jgi:hypothetical protein
LRERIENPEHIARSLYSDEYDAKGVLKL